MFQKCYLPYLARQASRNSATPSSMPIGLHALRTKSFTNSSLRRVQDDGTVTPSAATATSPVEHSPSSLNEAEQAIKDKLKSGFEGAKVDVQDVSGGCGTFYAISLAHPSFKGLSTIKQHQQVNKLLSEEIKSWHGLQLTTRSE